MAEVCPFRGYFAARPAEVLGPAGGQELDGDRIAGWIASGALERAEGMAIYPYHQLFVDGGKSRTWRGFVCLVRLEKPGGRRIGTFETLPEPDGADLAALRERRASVDPITLVYRDESGELAAALDRQSTGRPIVQATIDGVIHRLWAVTDRSAITTATRVLESTRLTIAGGQRAYAAAWSHRDEVEAARGNVHYAGSPGFAMAVLVDAGQAGLSIRATHRVLADVALPEPAEVAARLDGLFGLRSYVFRGDDDGDRVWRDYMEDLRIEGTAGPCLGFHRAGDDRLHLLVPADRAALDEAAGGGGRATAPAVLDDLILPALEIDPAAVAVEADPRRAWARTRAGSARAAIFVDAPRLDDALAAALGPRPLPAGSTGVHPPPLPGILLHRFED